VVTSTDTKHYTMAQLRASKKSLFIRNNTELLWTLHEKVANGVKIDIELKPVGQPDSIVWLNPAALDAPGIARNFASGKITVSPDLEEEMIELMGNGVGTRQKLLDQFQIGVEESPNRRAIDGKDKMDGILDRIQRRRVTGQGQQGEQNIIDEFTTPSLIPVDGGYLNPANGEFVPAAGTKGTAVAADEVGEDVASIIKSVTVQQSRSLGVKEN
jgi:hypothetical protein